MTNLKDYVCRIPFDTFQIHKDENWVCCPHWLTKSIPHKGDVIESWNSDEAIDIRKSVVDGTYKYCDSKSCPYLGDLVNFESKGNFGPIVHKSKLSNDIKQYYDDETGDITIGPKHVQLNFDMTCNYKCPSCRSDFFVSNSEEQKKIVKQLNEIDLFSDSIETLYSSTVGDPFASVPIRNFFRNLDTKRYRKLRNIHLHTNASLWTKEMWDTMKSIHPYVHTCEISIDAGTKETYETKTRLGGNWDNLITNLKFISTIETIHRIKCSFVVQADNYMEMGVFVDIIKSIFGTKGKVFLCRLQNWNSYTPTQYSLQEVHNANHPEHSKFLKEFNKVCFDDYVFHNLHEFMDIKKTLM
jgi:hypothetical protein